MKLNTTIISPLCLLLLLTIAVAQEVACIDETSVRVVFVEWKPDNGPLVTRGFNGLALTEAETKTLTAEKVGGLLTIVGSSVHGKSSNADSASRRIIIIMQQQLDRSVEFKQPVASDVIFLQREDRWQMLPSDVPTNDRVIKLEIHPKYRNQVKYWFQLPDGAMQGMTAFEW